MPLRGRSLQGTSRDCWGWTTELPLMAKVGYGDVARLNLWATLTDGVRPGAEWDILRNMISAWGVGPVTTA